MSLSFLDGQEIGQSSYSLLIFFSKLLCWVKVAASKGHIYCQQILRGSTGFQELWQYWHTLYSRVSGQEVDSKQIKKPDQVGPLHLSLA